MKNVIFHKWTASQRRGNPKDPGPRNLVLMPVISVRVGRPVEDLGMIGLTQFTVVMGRFGSVRFGCEKCRSKRYFWKENKRQRREQ